MEEKRAEAVYSWLDPQRTSYGFGYGSPWSLAGLVHAPFRKSSILTLPSVADQLLVWCSSSSSSTSGCHHVSSGYGFVPVAATPVRESLHDGDGSEANGHNFQRWRSSLLPVWSCGGGSANYLVFVHAAIGGGWPMLSLATLL
jgi:hypothetical protein